MLHKVNSSSFKFISINCVTPRRYAKLGDAIQPRAQAKYWNIRLWMYWKHDAKDVLENYAKDVMEPGPGYDEDFIRGAGECLGKV